MREEEEETLLVLLVQQGDCEAFAKLLRRIYRPLRGYVAGLIGTTSADDVLQEVSLRVYRQVRWLREPQVFRAWVYRIATRVAFAQLKMDRRWQGDADLERLEESAGPVLEFEVDAGFMDMADRVSPASRAVLLLHYQQHLSLEETAAVLDVPLGTVKSRLAYGIATLRKLLKEKTI